jgi:hypothetical protein
MTARLRRVPKNSDADDGEAEQQRARVLAQAQASRVIGDVYRDPFVLKFDSSVNEKRQRSIPGLQSQSDEG